MAHGDKRLSGNAYGRQEASARISNMRVQSRPEGKRVPLSTDGSHLKFGECDPETPVRCVTRALLGVQLPGDANHDGRGFVQCDTGMFTPPVVVMQPSSERAGVTIGQAQEVIGAVSSLATDMSIHIVAATVVEQAALLVLSTGSAERVAGDREAFNQGAGLADIVNPAKGNLDLVARVYETDEEAQAAVRGLKTLLGKKGLHLAFGLAKPQPLILPTH